MRSGTEVQSKMHQPGLCSSFDLNYNDENGSTNLGQFHDSSLDREQLSKVMLRHDSVFGQQVHELHRVYRIQREMMNELRNKELNRHMLAVNTPEWHASGPEVLDLNRPFSIIDDMKLQSFDLTGKDVQYGFDSTLNGYKVNPLGALEFQGRKIQRRLFDLERPANEYANIEEGGLGTSSMTGINSYLPKRRREVSYIRNGSFSNGGPTTSNQSTKRTNGFTDLNEPIQVCSKGKEECISHQNFHLKAETTQEWLFHKVETGRPRFAGVPYPTDTCESTKSLQVGHAIVHPDLFRSYAQSQNERCVKKFFGVEVLEITNGKSTAASNALDQLAVSGLSGVTNSDSFSMNRNLFRTTSSSSCTQNLHWGMPCQKGIIFAPTSESYAFPASCSSVGFRNQNGNSCSNSAIDLNVGALPTGSYQNGTVSPSNLLPDSSRKMESHRGSSWNHSQQSVDKPERQKSPYRSCTQDSPPATCIDNTKSNNKKIFGFSITGTTSKDSLIPHFPTKPKSPTLANGEANKPAAGLLDLNLSITDGVVEDAEPTLSSPEIEEVIDLEAPVTIESESSTNPVCEPPTSSQGETKAKDDVLSISAAAEALLSISMSNAEMESLDGETLRWLAEIASSLTSSDEDGVGDEIDYFELMTLNIKETGVEEVCYKPELRPQQEGKQLPRRGQARRGKKRKDFQRDVLPNLTSLTRNEMAKDINAMEGLIRASGGNWQSALTKKRNAKGSLGKGNVRSVVGSTSPMKTVSCLNPVKQPKLCLEESCLLVSGWGKRTRRPPRQRCVLNNPPLLVK